MHERLKTIGWSEVSIRCVGIRVNYEIKTFEETYLDLSLNIIIFSSKVEPKIFNFPNFWAHNFDTCETDSSPV